MRPRVPITTRPQGAGQIAPGLGAPLPAEALPAPSSYAPNPRSLLFELQDEGPPTGLTLDQATERLVRASVALRSKSLDIPQAQADILTAGMLANPVVYFDGQLLPYKQYNSVTNPGGPAQYDLNVAYPVDLSGKRRARVEVASAASRVIEALYQDAVRQEISRLYSGYVDALAARLSVRTINSGLARIDEVRERLTGEHRDPKQDLVFRRQIQFQRQTLAMALVEAEAAWRNNRRALATLLDLPLADAPRIELRGSLRDTALRRRIAPRSSRRR